MGDKSSFSCCHGQNGSGGVRQKAAQPVRGLSQ